MKKWIALVGAVIIIVAIGVLVFGGYHKKKAVIPPEQQGVETVEKSPVTVSISTPKGEILVELRPDLMPITVTNFLKLLDSKFYEGLTFHRVEDWVVQGGDPRGDGTGGPGWEIKLETNPQLKNERGAIAMARSSEPDSAGSQFYILKNNASWLDGQYAVFGKVIKGMEVVDQLAIGDKMNLKRVQK